MKIAVVDGQGGKLGRQLVEKISASVKNAEILAIGTNSAASAAMLKGGADAAATGENALIVACRKADVIVELGRNSHCRRIDGGDYSCNGGGCRLK